MHLIQFYVIKAVFCRLTGTLRWQLPVPRLVRVRLDADDGLRRQSQNLRRCRTRFAGSRNTPKRYCSSLPARLFTLVTAGESAAA